MKWLWVSRLGRWFRREVSVHDAIPKWMGLTRPIFRDGLCMPQYAAWRIPINLMIRAAWAVRRWSKLPPRLWISGATYMGMRHRCFRAEDGRDLLLGIVKRLMEQEKTDG